jgi:hypothetical protein
LHCALLLFYILVPHSIQNLAPGASSTLQLGQALESRFPQDRQNFDPFMMVSSQSGHLASSDILLPQFKQNFAPTGQENPH